MLYWIADRSRIMLGDAGDAEGKHWQSSRQRWDCPAETFGAGLSSETPLRVGFGSPGGFTAPLYISLP